MRDRPTPTGCRSVLKEFEIAVACEDMAENNVDFAHFQFVHGTDAIPEDDFVVDGTYKRTVGKDGNFVREGFGLGPRRAPHHGLHHVPVLDHTDRRGARARALALHRAPGQRRRCRGRRRPRRCLQRCQPGHPDLGEQDLPLPAGADQGRAADPRAPAVGPAVLHRRGAGRRARGSDRDRDRPPRPTPRGNDDREPMGAGPLDPGRGWRVPPGAALARGRLPHRPRRTGRGAAAASERAAGASGPRPRHRHPPRAAGRPRPRREGRVLRGGRPARRAARRVPAAHPHRPRAGHRHQP